jgi:hypothetical protein
LCTTRLSAWPFFVSTGFIVGVHGAAFRPVVLLRMMLTMSQVLQEIIEISLYGIGEQPWLPCCEAKK